MSDKPVRVYQGVRVKTTVKELLQRQRAEEANRKKVKTITPACLERQELSSTFPSHHVDPVHAVPPADAHRALQMRAAPFPVSSCNGQLQESAYIDCQHQLWDMFPGNGYSGSSTNNIIINNSNNNNNNNIGGGGFSSSLPPPPTLPLPWWHGLSSDADYYGPEVAVCSTPESLKLCSPMDHNSYSPQDSFSSSSSSCYDSPSRMESSSYPSFTPEHYHYQQCNLQDCYCLPPFWTGQQESLTSPEYSAYHSATDYPYACPVDENYFKKDFPVSSEMCYNVL